jgi:transposase
MTHEAKIALCDDRIIAQMATLPTCAEEDKKPLPPRKPGRSLRCDLVAGTELRKELYRCTGVDLTAIEGIGVLTAQVVISEICLDMSRWPTEKHFSSWLGLCPDHRISGGKVLSRHARHVLNPVADALRIAATTLQNSKTALGAFYRRMRVRLGAASAITATAHANTV